MEETVPTVEVAECRCCGLEEECTVGYIDRVRERHGGVWICGLCAEAVKDEIGRSELRITIEEALFRHVDFCNRFRSASPPSDGTNELFSSVTQIFRRSLSSASPRPLPSSTNSSRLENDRNRLALAPRSPHLRYRKGRRNQAWKEGSDACPLV